MATTAITAQGTTISLGDAASPIVYTAIANITSWDGPNRQANDIDVTDLSSTAREYMQGLEDEGEVTLSGFYLASDTTHAALQDAVGGNAASTFKIALSDTATLTFSARVSQFGISGGVDAPVEMSMTLKISGGVTRVTA
jgi:predicted secreted protein